MHMYALVRAEKYRLDRWMNDISGQYLEYNDPSGQISKVSLAVREVKLVEFVFPETALNEVCAIIQPYGYSTEVSRFLWPIRTALNLAPIPRNIPDARKIMTQNVEVIGLGIRKDGLNWVGGERL